MGHYYLRDTVETKRSHSLNREQFQESKLTTLGRKKKKSKKFKLEASNFSVLLADWRWAPRSGANARRWNNAARGWKGDPRRGKGVQCYEITSSKADRQMLPLAEVGVHRVVQARRGRRKGAERRASSASLFLSYFVRSLSCTGTRACGWKKCINFLALMEPNRCPPGEEGYDSPSAPHVPLSFDMFSAPRYRRCKLRV